MNITITPGRLRGTITPPPSKSQAHRALIAAALAAGESRISHVSHSQDMKATLGCMTALGASAEWTDSTEIRLAGIGERTMDRRPVLDCGESGSTLRFLIPIALAVAGGGVFRGHGRLMRRPQDPYFEIFREKGIAFSQRDDTLVVEGVLTPGQYRLRGDVSSQFITGLLYALPLLDGDSEICLTTVLESAGYIDMTLETLAQFGVAVQQTEGGWHVPGGQRYLPCSVTVEPDWSQAGFWYAAQGIGNEIAVAGMNLNSPQGDKIILDWGRRIRREAVHPGAADLMWEEQMPGAIERWEEDEGVVSIDVSHSPDLVPPVAAWGALMNGTLHIRNAARLRIKESDRLASVAAVLGALGADIQEEPEGLIIRGKAALDGGVTVDSWNDHRIAMMAAVAATRCRAPVTITGAESVNKSYPEFWQDYRALGGIAEES